MLFTLAQADPGGAREIIDNLARTPLSQVVMFVLVLTVLRLGVFPILIKTPPHQRGGGYGFAKFINEASDALVYAGVFVFMIIRPFVVQAFLIPTGSMWPTLYVNDFIVANKAIYRYTEPKRSDIVVFRPPKGAIQDPSQISEDGQVKVDYIKRLIGIPGDVIELREGVLYRNGQKVEEPYKHYSDCVQMTMGGICQQFRPLTAAEQDSLTKTNFKPVKRDGELIPLNWTDRDVNSPFPDRNFTEKMPPYGVANEYAIADQDEGQALVDQPAQPIPPGYFLMMGDNRNGSFDSRGWGLVPRESIIGRAEFIWWPPRRWRSVD